MTQKDMCYCAWGHVLFDLILVMRSWLIRRIYTKKKRENLIGTLDFKKEKNNLNWSPRLQKKKKKITSIGTLDFKKIGKK